VRAPPCLLAAAKYLCDAEKEKINEEEEYEESGKTRT
jgi:hypothetical protein